MNGNRSGNDREKDRDGENEIRSPVNEKKGVGSPDHDRHGRDERTKEPLPVDGQVQNGDSATTPHDE